MQLFVVPITGNFLFHKSRALEMEYGFAIEHHIPVLPIVVEGGLENDFSECLNRIRPGYGDIQFISCVSRDNTEIPYSEKLERYLSSVLIGDELAERVRAAFDAYIFISYRKKDRQYAQELMRLIHRIPFCENIATWYDEFLVPGEEWDKNIVEAMRKSICVAITVTPNLVEPDNFIIKREYPDAINYGKTVIPAELLPTDMASLRRLFPGISDTIDGRNETELTEALKTALRGVALTSNKAPEHDYLIGLAYLGGVDVEKDTGIAVRLIMEAADRGLPEAIGKLADMYQNGDGVNRDYEASAVWQEKLVDIYRECYANDASEKNYDDFRFAMSDLAGKFFDLAKLNRAKTCFDEMIKTARDNKDLVISYNGLANVLLYLGELSEAYDVFEKALKLQKVIVSETRSIEDRRNLAYSYNNFGILLHSSEKLSKARNAYEEALKLRKVLAAETETIEDMRNLALSYNNFGVLLIDLGELSEARDVYEKALELQKVLIAETETIGDRQGLFNVYNNLGNVLRGLGELNEARNVYEKAQNIAKVLMAETETFASRRILALSYDNLGILLRKLGELSEAQNVQEKALKLQKALVAETGIIEDRRNLALVYRGLGILFDDLGKLSEARNAYEKAVELRKALTAETRSVEDRRNLASIYNNLGVLSHNAGEMIKALNIYEKAVEIRRELVAETGSIVDKRDLALSYDNLGITLRQLKELSEAQKVYEEAVELRKALMMETKTIADMRNLADSYKKLGNVLRKLGKLDEAQTAFEKALELL